MAEYIEREALIDWLTKPTGFKTNCEDCTSIDCLDCIVGEAIRNAPTVDVAPVVHGRWYDVNSYEHGEKAIATCSHCRVRGAVRTKRTEWGFWVIDSPMCPNCGARMDGEG